MRQPAEQLASDDFPRGELCREEVLERAAGFLVGDRAGHEGWRHQHDQEEVLTHEDGNVLAGEPPEGIAVGEDEGLGEVAGGEDKELEDEPGGIGAAQQVELAAAAAEEQFEVQNRSNHFDGWLRISVFEFRVFD